MAKTHERRHFICKLWESAYLEFEWNFLILAQHGKAIAYLDNLIKTFPEPENVTPENLMWHFTNFTLRGEEKDYANVFGYEKWDISHCIDYRDSRAAYFANKAMGVKLSFNVTVGDLEQEMRQGGRALFEAQFRRKALLRAPRIWFVYRTCR